MVVTASVAIKRRGEKVWGDEGLSKEVCRERIKFISAVQSCVGISRCVFIEMDNFLI